MTEDITKTRNFTHGSFITNACFSQDLKLQMRKSGGWNKLNNSQKEALDIIALKISRILAGKANYVDHWLDIEGYAILGRKSCTSS